MIRGGATVTASTASSLVTELKALVTTTEYSAEAFTVMLLIRRVAVVEPEMLASSVKSMPFCCHW